MTTPDHSVLHAHNFKLLVVMRDAIMRDTVGSCYEHNGSAPFNGTSE